MSHHNLKLKLQMFQENIVVIKKYIYIYIWLDSENCFSKFGTDLPRFLEKHLSSNHHDFVLPVLKSFFWQLNWS